MKNKIAKYTYKDKFGNNVTVEAIQYIRSYESPVVDFLGGYDIEKHQIRTGEYETDVAIYQMCWYDQSCSITLKTQHGKVPVNNKDYIIKEDNEFYPCSEIIFNKMYRKL